MNGLAAFKCKKCGRIHHPKHARCLTCRGREFEIIHPEGTARLLTFTDACSLPWGIDERCRTLGVVEFENKLKAMGLLRVAHPKLGMKLKASWEPVRIIGGEEAYGLTLEAA